ncbi:PREDICTED: uncharacterized protein LOC284861-like [Elephantulus edwardii]|uniref:uncharacterized protein LOC284861-like n=1 Tax=Elephantulus edwardii TaxID=28737 RepID=UPI0003F0ED3A|nr:PREDICTED: uncharacterized protein LOC284861-like [Elephantulus edwardii]
MAPSQHEPFWLRARPPQAPSRTKASGPSPQHESMWHRAQPTRGPPRRRLRQDAPSGDSPNSTSCMRPSQHRPFRRRCDVTSRTRLRQGSLFAPAVDSFLRGRAAGSNGRGASRPFSHSSACTAAGSALSPLQILWGEPTGSNPNKTPKIGTPWWTPTPSAREDLTRSQHKNPKAPPVRSPRTPKHARNPPLNRLRNPNLTFLERRPNCSFSMADGPSCPTEATPSRRRLASPRRPASPYDAIDTRCVAVSAERPPTSRRPPRAPCPLEKQLLCILFNTV